MTTELQLALKEIEDMTPMDRREFAMKYVREHLPVEEAKEMLLKKEEFGYYTRMFKAGYMDIDYTLSRIGKDRVKEYIETKI